MQKIKNIYFLDHIDHSLIDYANLKKSTLFKQNKLLTIEEVKKKIKKKYEPIPILIRNNKKFFSFNKTDIYKIDANLIKKNIFFSENKEYQIAEKFCKEGLNFVSNCNVKKKYIPIVKKIIDFNLNSKKQIKKILNKHPSVIAFQTRNIPHLAHEAIIKNLLKKFSHVVINPILGPKKMGDISNSALVQCYRYLIDNHYKDKLSFIPVIANMYYAGPKEAFHHSIIRRNLGFKYFYVGRDHAGALGFYNPSSATKFIKKNNHKNNIKIFTAKGGVFCQKCNNYNIKGTCSHRTLDISGTEFRKKLLERKTFIHARKDLQDFIHSNIKKIFN